MTEQIRTLERLNELAIEKKYVICPRSDIFGFSSGPWPATILLTFTGATILRFITAGLFVYEKKRGKKNENAENSEI